MSDRAVLRNLTGIVSNKIGSQVDIEDGVEAYGLCRSICTGTARPMAKRTSIVARPLSPHADLKLNRVLLKLSGEALGGPDGAGLDQEVLRKISRQLEEIFELGVQLGIVVGGGNIFRGLKGAASGMDRAQADYMGMLATVINSLALQDALETAGVPNRRRAYTGHDRARNPRSR